MLWKEEFGVSSIVALDPVATQVAVGRQRVEARGWEHSIVVTKGGIKYGEVLPYSSDSFTKVLSVDAAYHFRTRQFFFTEASRVLVPGGTLALADMVLSRPLSQMTWGQRCTLRLVGAAASIPTENMVDSKQYRRQLEDGGFSNVRCRSIGNDVIPGFCNFVRRHRNALGGVTASAHIGWLKLRILCWLLRAGHSGNVIDFILVSAVNGAVDSWGSPDGWRKAGKAPSPRQSPKRSPRRRIR